MVYRCNVELRSRRTSVSLTRGAVHADLHFCVRSEMTAVRTGRRLRPLALRYRIVSEKIEREGSSGTLMTVMSLVRLVPRTTLPVWH